jgi:hypothetical protein
MVKKAKPTIAEACQTCRFVLMESRADAGFCRRYPPTPLAGESEFDCTYPVVSPDDWCGEYKGPEQ